EDSRTTSRLGVIDEGAPARSIADAHRRGSDHLDELRGDVVLEFDAAIAEEELVADLAQRTAAPHGTRRPSVRFAARRKQEQVIGIEPRVEA
ncbi:hypothetical protein HER21_43360, partial [Pseudomonas sp. BGM005]|nr:hypothetical protein [Pseudomonas sp. BG5]